MLFEIIKTEEKLHLSKRSFEILVIYQTNLTSITSIIKK